MKNLTATLFVLSMLILTGCNPKQFPADYKGEQIHFGQGGGFTGAVSYFTLLDDGRLFQRSLSDSTFTLEARWKPHFTDQIFSNYKSLDLAKENFYEPGNLYYFIEFHKPGMPVHRMTWGKQGFKPNENVMLFYNLLYQSTKSSS